MLDLYNQVSDIYIVNVFGGLNHQNISTLYDSDKVLKSEICMVFVLFHSCLKINTV